MSDSPRTEHLMLSRSILDRDALHRTDELLPALLAQSGTRVLAMRGERMPALATDGVTRLRYRSPEAGDANRPQCYLGTVHGVAVVGVFEPPETRVVDKGPTDPGDLCRQREEGYRSLRSLASLLPLDDLGVATTAVAMANWYASQSFCSRCGLPTSPTNAGWHMECANGHTSFPRTDPAVIMSVIDDEERLLLAQGTRFIVPTGMSVLAGFLEPGESLEAAVRREVWEEVGVHVDEVSYVDNQPWPMPASLMVGFEARTSQTTLRLDPHEIRSARWFSRDELADSLAEGTTSVPPRLSIARHLIERWYGQALPPQPGDVS